MNRKFILILIFFIISFFLFGKTKIEDLSKKYNLDFYYIESPIEEGKYVNQDINNAGFKYYNNNKLVSSLKNNTQTMFTFISNFSISSTLKNDDLGICLGPKVWMYNLYINKTLVFKKGNFSKNEQYSTTASVSLYLSKNLLNYDFNNENELIIEVFPRPSQQQSIGTIFISSFRVCEKYKFWRNFFNIHFIQGSMLISLFIFFYFLISFFLSKTNKNKKYIYYCFICLFYILGYINIFFYSGTVLASVKIKISRAAIPLFTMFFTFFIYEYSELFNREKIIKYILISFIAFINISSFLLLIIFSSNDTIREYIFRKVISIVFLPLIISNLIVLFISIIVNKKITKIILFIGYLFVLVLSSLDIYFVSAIVTPYVWLTPYGFFIFLLSIFSILAYDQSTIRNEKLKLEKLDHLKNDFIANITHDFRSPLTAILNIADLSLKSNTKEKESYNIIYVASLRLKNTIDKLLELARIDAHGFKSEIKKVDPVEFLEKIINYYISILSGSNIIIKKILPDIKIDNFYIDEKQLEDAINNIVSNAIKYVPKENGIITISLKEYNKTILIAIEDNGIGIPKDKIKTIFNRFEQVEKSRNGYHRGTGIGLAYSKQLIEGLKGRIYAVSDGIGKGAKFFIELKKGKKHFTKMKFIDNDNHKKEFDENFKIIIKDELTKKNMTEELKVIFNELNKKNEYNVKKAKILIIDDDPIIRKIILNYLTHANYKNFILAHDGKSGIEAVKKYSPDLIICDYNMPGIKGDEVHNTLLSNSDYINIPFIFLSAITNEKIIMERRRKGACAYLKKPINEKDLLTTIERNLNEYFEYLKLINKTN